MVMESHHENIIIGAGPAGIQLAYFFQQRDEDYIILERNQTAGSYFAEFPRHRQLLSINKPHTGYTETEAKLRYDWNSLLCDDPTLVATNYSQDYFPNADIIVDYCRDFSEHYNLRIVFNSNVVNIDKSGEHFRINTEDGNTYTCRNLIVGTGLYTENIPAIDGIEHCKTYATASVNPEDYRNKRVFILGKSNSAFEFADSIIGTSQKIYICSPNHVKFAWGTHYVGNLRAVNNNFIDTYLLKAQNNILEGNPQAVFKQNDELIVRVYFESRKRYFDFPCDEVILCTGFKFDSTMFSEQYQPERTPCGRLPKMDATWQSTNIDHLYFIGTLMQMRDYRKTMSAFIHGFRHNIEALDQILDQHCAWRKINQVTNDLDSLTDKVLQRLSRSASIFLQPGFMVDLFWLEPNNQNVTFWHDVPIDYAKVQGILNQHVFTVSLEYKPCDDSMNPVAMPRGVGVDEDFYLHPIIREYKDGKCINRLFLADDLDNDWLILPEHRESLRQQFLPYFHYDQNVVNG